MTPLLNRWRAALVETLGLAGVFAVLWYLRSWNLMIGDGEFVCKQTLNEVAFPITLSRSFLSYLLYRGSFATMHGWFDWWVEDSIALATCSAGVVFFWALNRLAGCLAKSRLAYWIYLLFPASTWILQLFCGHIEFYSWTCALLMACAYFSWRSLHEGLDPIWPSAAMALAAGFHSSGFFYFPALLLLPILRTRQAGPAPGAIARPWLWYGATLAAYLGMVMLHRSALWYVLVVGGAAIALTAVWLVLVKNNTQAQRAWLTQPARQALMILAPWLVLLTFRASLNIRPEPLLEHVAPFQRPYDEGAYLYMFFSWGHLYDKTMFHLWLAPIGLASLLGFWAWKQREVRENAWLVYLSHFCIWAMVWSILFYPQLRTRDWDLFASMSIPLNLFAVGAWMMLAPRAGRWIALAMIVIHLSSTVPLIVNNSALLSVRGYCSVFYDAEPIPGDAYLRGLKLGQTPVGQANVRAGEAEINLIPTQRGYQSWAQTLMLADGEQYRFTPRFEPTQHPPVPPAP